MERLDYAKLSNTAAQAMFALEKTVSSLEIDKKLKQLIKIRVSQVNGCVFCVDMHVKEAKIYGERELRLLHLPVWRESSLFSETEKAALEWAELLTDLGPEGISDEAYDKVLTFFSEKQLSDMTFVILSINAWNRLGVAFRTKPGLHDKLFGLEKAGLE